MENLKARKEWSKVDQAKNENNFNLRILYPAKVSFKINGAIKIFPDKQKLKQNMITNLLLQRFSNEFCTQKMKANKTRRGKVLSNHRRRKDKESESSTDSAVHNQALKQQKQLNGRNHDIPMNINTECQQTQLPYKKTQFDKLG
jgi:hypothetical protein